MRTLSFAATTLLVLLLPSDVLKPAEGSYWGGGETAVGASRRPIALHARRGKASLDIETILFCDARDVRRVRARVRGVRRESVSKVGPTWSVIYDH